MRHAAEDVRDGYAHAELGEMGASLLRLPSPATPQPQVAVKTGTEVPHSADPMLDQTPATTGHSGAQGGTESVTSSVAASRSLTIDFAAKTAGKQQDSGECLIGLAPGDTVPKQG